MSHDEDEYDDVHLIFDIADFNLIDNLNFENYSIIGLDSERPIVKIDNFVFEGKFENLHLDTALCIKQGIPTTTTSQDHSDSIITTKQVLKLNRILLGPKQTTTTTE